jgi:predicted acetyltransferase
MKTESALFWKEIFDDTDEFIKLFFDNVYSPDNTLVIKQEGKVVAALQFIPYKVKVDDEMFNAAYICGVGTRESARGRGLMTKLMMEAMHVIENRGYDISLLIPAEQGLFDVYGRLGFVHEINIRHEVYDIDSPAVIARNREIRTGPCRLTHYEYFDRKQRERRCSVLHDSFDFRVIIKDFELDGGMVFTTMENEKPVGMAFAKPFANEAVWISELLYDNDIIKKILIDFTGNYFNADRVVVKKPWDGTVSCDDDVVRYGLARIHNENMPDISRLFMTLMLDS